MRPVVFGRHMLAEIGEQPAVLARVLAREARRCERLGEALRRLNPPVLVLAARGSSDHAAVAAKYLVEWATGTPVALAAPSLATLYRAPLKLRGAAVIGVSQSGRSPDVVEYLRASRRAGALAVAVTNDPGSPLARVAQETLLCHAGSERSVAATKTFTAQLAGLALLASAWAGGERGRLLSRGLRLAPERLRRLLSSPRAAEEAARRLAGAERGVVLGRGFAYPAALELALKLKESAGLACEGASAADYLHGPVAAAGPGLAALLLAPAGPGLPTLRRAAAQLEAAGAEVLAASGDRSLARSAAYAVDVAKGWPEPLSPLPLVVFGQRVACGLAALKGRDPDQPPRLRKVTTTW